MASSIKIKNETKIELDKLQAMLILKLGRKISQQDLIEILVKNGTKNVNELIEFRPLEPSIINDILALASSSKIKTNPDMLDDLLIKEN